jgi:aspartyl-tRNA(Asn)/glutamyl-tRNA(Gln) amidotransferase subunit C
MERRESIRGRDFPQADVYDFRQVFPIFSVSGALVTLTRRDVENIAHLARLGITETELPTYVESLSAILAFVEQLSSAPTEGVPPMAHPLEDQVQRLRPDAVTESDRRAAYQANAPAVEAGLYLVPKVIE